MPARQQSAAHTFWSRGKAGLLLSTVPLVGNIQEGCNRIECRRPDQSSRHHWLINGCAIDSSRYEAQTNQDTTRHTPTQECLLNILLALPHEDLRLIIFNERIQKLLPTTGRNHFHNIGRIGKTLKVRARIMVLDAQKELPQLCQYDVNVLIRYIVFAQPLRDLTFDIVRYVFAGVGRFNGLASRPTCRLRYILQFIRRSTCSTAAGLTAACHRACPIWHEHSCLRWQEPAAGWVEFPPSDIRHRWLADCRARA